MPCHLRLVTADLLDTRKRPWAYGLNFVGGEGAEGFCPNIMGAWTKMIFWGNFYAWVWLFIIPAIISRHLGRNYFLMIVEMRPTTTTTTKVTGACQNIKWVLPKYECLMNARGAVTLTFISVQFFYHNRRFTTSWIRHAYIAISPLTLWLWNPTRIVCSILQCMYWTSLESFHIIRLMQSWIECWTDNPKMSPASLVWMHF